MAKKSYEGGQYRGGRQGGRKNLVRVEGGYRNQHGVTFTEEEKKALETAVNTANRKRNRMLKAEADATGQSVEVLRIMDKESDFILAPKTKSLQRFKSKEAYENYLANLQNVNRREYVDERTIQYRENYNTALDNAFGDEANDIKEALNNMSPKEYREFVAEADDVLEIGYIYLPSRRTEKLNEIRSKLGLETVEVPDDEEVTELRRAVRRNKHRRINQ